MFIHCKHIVKKANRLSVRIEIDMLLKSMTE